MKTIPGTKCPKCDSKTVCKVEGVSDIALWCTTCGWRQIDYDSLNVRKGNPFRAREKYSKGNNKLNSVLVFFIIVIVVSIFAVYTPGSTLGKSVLSNSQAAYLGKIDNSHKDIDGIMKQLSEQHKIPLSARNIETYRNLLVAGITKCESAKINIDSTKPTKDFQLLHYLALEYTSNTQNALKNYLDFTYSKNNAFLINGNNFLQQSNKNRKDYMTGLVSYLEKHNYKYELLANGSIRYWYKEGLFEKGVKDFENFAKE